MNPVVPESVLVVDDEPHVRLYISLILRQLGVRRVLEAGDGAAAIALAPQTPLGLVLLDINMPGGSGLQVLRELKELLPECPVVMLTSLGSRFAIEEAVDSGASGYIRKDTPRAEVARLILAVLEAEARAGGEEESE